jgi:hypothetical protein
LHEESVNKTDDQRVNRGWVVGVVSREFFANHVDIDS